MFSVSGFVVANAFAGDNRFKSVRVGGGAGEIGDDTPSEMISILIGRPSEVVDHQMAYRRIQSNSRPSTIFPSYFA